ncbi:hypothetical protein C4375_14145 [Devosia sp. I507]|nr:hypothetical protein C4375_14145 [Devosia sp. I507]
MMIRSQKILRSAKGQTCAFRFPGICNGGTETTVWAHLNGGRFGKGMGMKAHDVLGGHACFWCHRYIDGGHFTAPQMTDGEFFEGVLGGVTETYVRLIVAGLVIVPLDPERPASERAAKPRKPPEQRTKINSRNDWPTGQKIQSRNDLRKRERT